MKKTCTGGGTTKRSSFVAKFLFPKNPLLVILNSLILTGFFCFTFYALASYNPGDTLDPACNPTDPSCVVASPTTGITGINLDNIFSSNGLLKRTGAGTYTVDSNNYLTSYTETDPTFTSSIAHGILSSDISNWNSKAGYSFGSNNFTGTGTINAGAITGTSLSIGSNTISNLSNLSSLSGLTYTSGSPLIKMTSLGTFALDPNTYLTTATVNGLIPYTGATSDLNLGNYNLITSGNITGNFTTTYTAAPINQASVVHQDPTASIAGNGYYSYGYAEGYYTTISSSTNINQIIANIYTTGSDAVTLKIFVLNNIPSSHSFDINTNTPTYSTTIPNGNFPKSGNASGNTINFGSSVAINTFPVGTTYVFIMFQTPSAAELHYGYWNAINTGYPNTGFVETLNSDTMIVYGSSPTYLSGGFQLNGTNDITKTVSSSIGSEVLQNPGFESGTSSSFTNWSIQGGATVETSLVHSGTRAVKLSTTTGNAWYANQAYQTFTVTPNTTYYLSFWARGDGSHAGGFGPYDVTHSAYITPSGYAVNGVPWSTGVTSTTYTQVNTSFTTPAGCTSVRLFFGDSGVASSSTTFYFDDISIKPQIFTSNYNQLGLGTILSNLPAAGITFADPNGVMTSTNVNAGIVEAYNHASSSGLSGLTPRIILPPEITAVVGDELQVFTRGVIEAQNPYNLPYTFTSSVGSSFPRYFDYTPVIGDVGTHPLTVSITDLQQNQLATASTNLVVVNATGQPSSNKNVLCIGDSLTAGGNWPAEAYRRLTQSGGTPAGKGYGNIKFMGDVPMSSYPTQGFTAWGGWTYGLHMGTSSTTGGYVLTGTFDKTSADVNSIYSYASSTYRIMETSGRLQVALYSGSDILPSAGTLTYVSGGTHTSNIVYSSFVSVPMGSVFWDTSLNRASFTSWFARQGGVGNIDIVYILLGWNEIGTGPNATDHSAAVTAAEALIDRLHSDYPSAQVRLLGVEVPSYNGGLGTNYGASSSLSQYYNTVRNAMGYNLAMQSIAQNSGYSSFVRYLGMHSQFDNEYNMVHTAVPVNTRNATTEDRQTNGVHPDTTGYMQIADIVYRDFIRTFDSN